LYMIRQKMNRRSAGESGSANLGGVRLQRRQPSQDDWAASGAALAMTIAAVTGIVIKALSRLPEMMSTTWYL
jgi:hypothetical protein